jgi:hypothetical protein
LAKCFLPSPWLWTSSVRTLTQAISHSMRLSDSLQVLRPSYSSRCCSRCTTSSIPLSVSSSKTPSSPRSSPSSRSSPRSSHPSASSSHCTTTSTLPPRHLLPRSCPPRRICSSTSCRTCMRRCSDGYHPSSRSSRGSARCWSFRSPGASARDGRTRRRGRKVWSGGVS